MNQVTDEQARRLEMLAARRAGASKSAPRTSTTGTPWGPPKVDSVVRLQPTLDPHTRVNVIPSGRRHTALAAKFVTTGLAASGFLGAVGSLAMDGAASSGAAAAPADQNPTQSTVVVLETIHNVVYVDEFGNPVAPPSTTTTAVPDPALAGAVPVDAVIDPLAPVDPMAPATIAPVPGAPAAAPAPGTPTPVATVPRGGAGGTGSVAPTPAGVTPVATTPTAVAPTPGATPAPGPTPTAPPVPAPAGTPTPAPAAPTATTAAPVPAAPTVTTAPAPPAPVVTQPPAPPPTTAAPPPPPTTAPPAPACQTSQC